MSSQSSSSSKSSINSSNLVNESTTAAAAGAASAKSSVGSEGGTNNKPLPMKTMQLPKSTGSFRRNSDTILMNQYLKLPMSAYSQKKVFLEKSEYSDYIIMIISLNYVMF